MENKLDEHGLAYFNIKYIYIELTSFNEEDYIVYLKEGKEIKGINYFRKYRNTKIKQMFSSKHLNSSKNSEYFDNYIFEENEEYFKIHSDFILILSLLQKPLKNDSKNESIFNYNIFFN